MRRRPCGRPPRPRPGRALRRRGGAARIGEDRSGPVRVTEFDNLELPEEERKRIWEIEHGVNVLNKYGFEPLAEALASGESSRIARFLAPRFAGSEPAAPTRARLTGFANVERSRAPAPRRRH